MFTYQPYTYHIAWTGEDLHYYGVRYASDCNPNDFWNTYYTSSKVVSQHRIVYGEPDLIEIRKTFADADSAIDWEHKVLRRLNVMESDRWVNRSIGHAPRFHESHREALSKARTGYKFSQATKDKLSAIRKAEWEDPILRAKRSVSNHTPDGLERIAEFQTGRVRTEDHKQLISDMRKAEWADEEKAAARKKAISDKIKAKWADPEYRAKQLANRKKRQS